MSLLSIKSGLKGYQVRKEPKVDLTPCLRLLKRREGDVANGKLPGIHFDKVTFDELAEDFLTDYRINQKKSLGRAQYSVNHLRKTFEGMRVTNITTTRVNKYVMDRLGEGAANATVNRELAALKCMLNLGAKNTPPKVDRVPHIAMLKESNTRKGFFEHEEFLVLRDALPSHLKDLATFGYKVGWRISEITTLKWNQIDLLQGIVRLEVGETKNDEGRTVYLDDELKEIFNQLWDNRKDSEKLLPWVFVNQSGTDRVKRFDKTWKKACKDSGIGIRLFHDFRRTAVRNMVRSGNPERVAMMISGHKTRSVFDRYNIVNDQDLKLAAQRQQAYLDSQMGKVSGKVVDFKDKLRYQNES
ncbi:site-specific integrase [bacterium]|nr:site-specific integrase [bacterium]